MLSTFELGVDRISEIVHAAFHIRTWAGSALVEHAMVGKIAGRIASIVDLFDAVAFADINGGRRREALYNQSFRMRLCCAVCTGDLFWGAGYYS